MAASSSSSKRPDKILKRADPSTIQDKFLVGYQGWFTCAGDGEPVGPGHHGWLHWFDCPIPDGGHPNTDLWPDVSQYSPSELYPAPGLKTKSGEPVFLFSSRNAKTVQRHFHWMAEHGVDGAFLQRFAGQCDIEGGNEGIRRIRDEVGDRVMEAAEREGRVFAIMYDVVGVAPDRIKQILEKDWAHLVRNKGVLDSPNYLREKGKPVIALWGFGFDNAKHTPELVHSITQFFRDTTPGGVYIMAGAPASWRTAEGDADRNPDFLKVWTSDFDAISPWTVGRYSNDQEADQFMEGKMKADVDLIKQHNESGIGRKIDYIPVVLPGGSGCNMSQGQWGFNNIQRRGGRFLWKQISNAKRLGVRTIYGAMWDEYDEGTAFMPVVENKSQLPLSDKFRFMALDEDGYDCPSDWYMRICGFAAEGMRSERQIHETFPVKELQDYWSSRPRFEDVTHKADEFISGVGGDAGGSGEGQGQTYQEWLSSQKEDKNDLPPPPYTLIEDESAAQPSHTAATGLASVPPAVAGGATANVPLSSPQQPPPIPPPISHANAPDRNNTTTASHISSNTVDPLHAQSQPQQHHIHSTTVSSLEHALGHVRISGDSNSAGPSNVGDTSHVVRHDNSPSPVGRMHVVNAEPPNQNAPYPVQQTRPLNTSQSTSRPHSQMRPAQVPQSPPHSPGMQPNYGAPAVRPVSTAGSSEQWPPASWNVTPNRLSSASSPKPSVPSHQAVYGSAAGGANLSRPHTYTATGYGASGPALQPPVNYHTRPPAQSVAAAPANSSWPTAPSPVNNINARPSPPHSPNAYNNTTSFPEAGRFDPSRRRSSSQIPNQEYGMPNFPDSSRASYYSYGSHGESAYPGSSSRPSGSPYPPQPPPQSNYTSWPGGPHASSASAPYFPSQPHHSYSPPHSPFSAQYASGGPEYPYGPAPPTMPGRPLGTDGYESQPYQFPHGPGGEGGFYAGGGVSDMPSSSSPPFSSAYGSRYEMPSSTASFPGDGGGSGHGAQAYASAEPWALGGGGSASPMPPLPLRPPTHHSMTQGKPPMPSGAGTPPGPSSSPATSGPLGYALNAVDKLAGRKTREQLESRVGNLTQMASNSKLFGKFTK